MRGKSARAPVSPALNGFRMRTMMLRDLAKKDESLLEALDRRPEVIRFIGPVRGIGKEPRVKVIETNDGVSAGVVAVLNSQATGERDHELLCALLPDHERHGLATKACRLMLYEVSHDPSVHRVIGCVHRENTSSLALINRLGGTFLQHGEEIHSGQDIYVFE